MFNFNEYAELFENYVHNKDLISKTFGKDLRIVGWIAWGLGLFFQEKCPKEMFEYMKNPDLRLLSERIKIEDKDFFHLSGKGYELDSVYTIFNELLEADSFLNIENELSYSPTETPPRSLAYLNTISFNLGTFYKDKKFSHLQDSHTVWIIPNKKMKSNEYHNHKFNDTVSVDKMESLEIDNTQYNGFLDKLNAHFFFVGNPEKIKFSADLSEEELKKRITMYLIDTLYNLEIPTEKKLELLKPFSLTGDEIKQEVEMIENLNEEINNLFINMVGFGYDEVNQELLKSNQKDKLLKEKDTEINQFKTVVQDLSDQNKQYKTIFQDLKDGKIKIEDFRNGDIQISDIEIDNIE